MSNWSFGVVSLGIVVFEGPCLEGGEKLSQANRGAKIHNEGNPGGPRRKVRAGEAGGQRGA